MHACVRSFVPSFVLVLTHAALLKTTDGTTSAIHSSGNLLAPCFQVICEKADRSDIPDIDKKKYLVPADLSTGV